MSGGTKNQPMLNFYEVPSFLLNRKRLSMKKALLALAALFLFNMSMPLTLFASARLLKGAKGTAFGLLTAALFLGVVPFFLGVALPPSRWLFGALAAVSGVLLVIGLKELK